MITVSAKALWWDAPEACTCVAPNEDYPCPHDTLGGWPASLWIGEIEGVHHLTDRYVLLPVPRLTGLPASSDLGLQPLGHQALDGFAEMLTASPVPATSSPRLFARPLIDPLEQAGFKIRELVGVKDVHGICDPDMTVVGLIIPLARRLEDGDVRNTHRVAS